MASSWGSTAIFGYGSCSFRDVAPRKLLATTEVQAPSPGPAADLPVYVCRDVKVGVGVHCQNPQTLLVIVAGMSCMLLLATVAMLLLCWPSVRERRLREATDHQQLTGVNAPRAQTTAHTSVAKIPAEDVASNPPEYDAAVFVQLPGEAKPHFFALPTPFPTDSPSKADCDASIPADEVDVAQAAVAKGTASSNNRTNTTALPLLPK